jgi:hypothetical protein
LGETRAALSGLFACCSSQSCTYGILVRKRCHEAHWQARDGPRKPPASSVWLASPASDSHCGTAHRNADILHPRSPQRKGVLSPPCARRRR